MNLLYNNFKESIIILKNFIKWFLLSVLSGIIVGIVISFFLKSLQLATSIRKANPIIIALLPFGGALVSYLYLKYGKDSSKGNNLIIERINKGEADIPFRMAPLVFFGTFITHLFGGSAGREGTGVQIGASITSKLSKLLKLNKKDTTMIIISGVSSGFGVVFGTPIAGTIFGIEVSTIGKMRYEAIIPCLISSYIGNFIARLLKVQHTHYPMEVVSSSDYTIFYKVILCSILFGIISKLFSEFTHYLKQCFTQLIPKPYIKSFVGGCIVILIALVLQTQMYLGLSLDLLKNSFENSVVGYAFIIKLVLTSITLSTGFQGGEVTPLFEIGRASCRERV